MDTKLECEVDVEAMADMMVVRKRGHLISSRQTSRCAARGGCGHSYELSYVALLDTRGQRELRVAATYPWTHLVRILVKILVRICMPDTSYYRLRFSLTLFSRT